MQIHIVTSTASTITVGRETIPLAHGLHDNPGIVEAMSTSELDNDWPADEVTLTFKVVFNSRTVGTAFLPLRVHRLDPIQFPNPSLEIPDFRVSQPYCYMALEKSFWVLNAPLPKLLLELARFQRFQEWQSCSVILGASFVFVETRVAKSRVKRQQEESHATEVMTIPLTTGWPKSADAWERTVNLTVSNAPLLTTDCRTKYLNVLHSLLMFLKVKSESIRDFRAESIRLADK
ncbi:hypothetical protein BGZ47_009842 [Haplosporangium gracile]|nr:hypothetical protein BGZ47_009842 [Haplosporangium gracile]